MALFLAFSSLFLTAEAFKANIPGANCILLSASKATGFKCSISLDFDNILEDLFIDLLILLTLSLEISITPHLADMHNNEYLSWLGSDSTVDVLS